jgi:Family of unknown function (DUF6152)
MRMKLLAPFLAVSALFLSALPALAHHSFAAEFDGEKTVTVTGVLTKVEWINPHVRFHIDAKDSSGNVTAWEIATWPTGLLHKAGLSRQLFVEGQTVTMFGYRAKDGSRLAYLGKVTFADDRQFILWSAGRVDPSDPSQKNQ